MKFGSVKVFKEPKKQREPKRLPNPWCACTKKHVYGDLKYREHIVLRAEVMAPHLTD